MSGTYRLLADPYVLQRAGWGQPQGNLVISTDNNTPGRIGTAVIDNQYHAGVDSVSIVAIVFEVAIVVD